MAIYSFNAKIISRSEGQSAIATAAYNARDKLMDERTGEIKYYYAVDGSLLHSGIYTPENAPEWAQDREQLWNHAEAAEKRKDSQIARNFIVALPHELTDEQRRFAIQDFVKENFTRKGYAADLNIHAPDKDGDNRNYHAHILVTDRKLEPDGFAASKSERQQTETQRKEELEHLRQSWEKIGNRHLERWGHEPTLDRRTLEAQGIEREPTIHKGADVSAMERKGIETDRGHQAGQVEARNSQLKILQFEAAKLAREIRQAELEEKQKTRAAHEAATLYDKAGLVRQQSDAQQHHEARQSLLDKTNNQPRPEAPQARILREELESQNPQLKAERLQAEKLQQDRADWQKQHEQEKHQLKPENPENRIEREKLERENPELKAERLKVEEINSERQARQREQYEPKPEHPQDRIEREEKEKASPLKSVEREAENLIKTANDNKQEAEKDYSGFGAWVKRNFFGGNDELTEAKKEKFREAGSELTERGEEKAEQDGITRSLDEHNDRKRQTESAENYKTLTEGGDSSSASSRAQTPDEIRAEKIAKANARLERLSEEHDNSNDNREMGEAARERTRER